MALNLLKNVFYSVFIIIPILVPGCSNEGDTKITAPDFSLETISGETVTLSQYKGKTVILDFWATWCPPCRKSIPELVELQKKYRKRGLVVLGLSLDDPRQANDEYLQDFKEKYGINYDILRVDQKVTRKYFGKMEFSVPTLFVVNREGLVVDKIIGFLPGAVESALNRLFK